jgi:hypothetical protein
MRHNLNGLPSLNRQSMRMGWKSGVMEITSWNWRLKVLFKKNYRVSTKELYTFKIIQKTNAAYLELHTYTSR